MTVSLQAIRTGTRELNAPFIASRHSQRHGSPHLSLKEANHNESNDDADEEH